MSRRPTILQHILLCTVASLLLALGLDLFLIPNKIVNGGFSGLATVFLHLFGTPVGLVNLLLNIPLFLVAWRLLGRRFLGLTMYSAVVSSAFIDALSFLQPLSADPILAALYGGALVGLSMALLVLSSATSGGSDLLARLLHHKFPGLSISKFLALADGAIVLFAGIAYRDPQSPLYAIISIFVTSKVMDAILNGFDYAKVAYIVTDRPKQVADAVFQIVDRGVTQLEAQGMYSGERKYVLMSVIRKMETVKLKQAVKEADPNAFVFLSPAVEVLGNGFKAHELNK